MDDGPCDDRAALDLLRCLEAESVTEVVATPHTLDGRFDVSRARMLDGVGRLQERAIEAGLGIQIHPGAEVMVQADLPEVLRRGEVSTLADTGRYLLVETSFQVVPPEIDRLFFELQLEGVVPVLAHPERTLPVQKHPDRLIPLIQAGTLVQLDASSLTGHFGREARRAAILLLDRGLGPSGGVRRPRPKAASATTPGRVLVGGVTMGNRGGPGHDAGTARTDSPGRHSGRVMARTGRDDAKIHESFHETYEKAFLVATHAPRGVVCPPGAEV